MEAQAGQGAQKVPLYSINDLKNATDDALAPYLTKLPSPYTFHQSHYLSSVRLAVGYSAVVIAATTFYFDYKLGWDATKEYTALACVLYFILNGFLTLWIWRVEAGKVFVGVREGKQTLTLKSSVKKNVPIYRLNVLYEAPSGKKWEDKEIEGRFTEWFDDKGWLHPTEFRRWLAKNIEVLSKADPQDKKQIVDGKSTGLADSAPTSTGNTSHDSPGGPKSAKKSKRKV